MTSVIKKSTMKLQRIVALFYVLLVSKRRFVIFLLSSLFLLYFLDQIPSMTLGMQNDFAVDTINYLDTKGKREFLLNLPNCQIPVELEESSTSLGQNGVGSENRGKKLSERAQCRIRQPQFSLIKNGSNLIMGPEWKSKEVKCCYKGIRRVHGSDTKIILTEGCIQIPADEKGTAIESEYAILVSCNYEDYEYHDFHPIIRNIEERASKSSSTNSPIAPEINKEIPNILIIGLDSVSRFHFEQFMPKTRKILVDMDFIEFHGHTKVGLNTFPNNIPFLTGFSADQVSEFCYKRYEPIDDCPFIWKNLTHGMTTAYLEDAPSLTMFNYFKFGFFNPPTDYYLRPLMIKAGENYAYTFPCVGSRTVEAFMWEHIEQLHSLKNPLFLFSWMTSLAHEGTENLPEADLLFYSYFEKLKPQLGNTIIFFMSDHGLRYGNNRRSFNGWFESKLPFFTITLPESVKRVLGPQKVTNLRENSRKLTTSFDIYHTLVDILDTFDIKSKEFTLKSIYKNGKYHHRSFGQSLFTPVPETRTCKDAGIPMEYCPCTALEPLSLTNLFVKRAAEKAVKEINGWLPGKCRQLEIDKVTAAARLSKDEFIVGFTTTPGGFEFEITVGFNNGIGKHGDGTRRGPISRVNKINWWQTACVSDWSLELYCYCTYFGSIVHFFSG